MTKTRLVPLKIGQGISGINLHGNEAIFTWGFFREGKVQSELVCRKMFLKILQ